MNTFKHSGDIGDTILCLPTIRALGGGILYLSELDRTRVRMNDAVFNSLAPLLRAQPYIKAVERYSGQSVKYDLDEFRDFWAANRRWGRGIASYCLGMYGLPDSEANTPWITVPATSKHVGRPVVVHRSLRYRNPHFPWDRIVETYGKRMLLIGVKEEWDDWFKEFGEGFTTIETANLLEVAMIIAGCQLFIGNQSAPCAIAEGLKHHMIQATDPFDPTSVFKRRNAQYIAGRYVVLPTVE